MLVLSVEPKIEIEPNRVIEISKLGKFYITGTPNFQVLKVFDPLAPDGARDGYLIIDETLSFSSDPYVLNKLFKMLPNNKLIPALFKNEEMAETVCFACNRIKV